MIEEIIQTIKRLEKEGFTKQEAIGILLILELKEVNLKKWN